jgi:hypothetical protein
MSRPTTTPVRLEAVVCVPVTMFIPECRLRRIGDARPPETTRFYVADPALRVSAYATRPVGWPRSVVRYGEILSIYGAGAGAEGYGSCGNPATEEHGGASGLARARRWITVGSAHLHGTAIPFYGFHGRDSRSRVNSCDSYCATHYRETTDRTASVRECPDGTPRAARST